MHNHLFVAKVLTEKLLNGHNEKLDKECFFMFTISKFILLKERILKKNSVSKEFYFDNVKYASYIPFIINLMDEIKKSGCSYKKNNFSIEYKNPINDPTLDEALWFLSKIRDSLAHGMYSIDLDRDTIVIYNNHENDANSYKLICNIPVDLLNKLSFYISQIDNKDYKFDDRAYEKYMNNITKYYEYHIKKNYSKLLNKKEIIINKVYDYPIKKNDNMEIYDEFSLYNKLINAVSYKELYTLVKQLLRYRPLNKREKELVCKVLEEIKVLYKNNKKTGNNTEYNLKTQEIIDEISKILKLDTKVSNPDGIVALYNYMSLAFTKTNIDYAHMCVKNLHFYFDPLGYYDENNPSTYDNLGRKKEYDINIASINKECNKFVSDMDNSLVQYQKYANDKFRHDLMSRFANFYQNILNLYAKKNECIMTPIRNAIEHGNYLVKDDNSIYLCDQKDHRDLNSVNYACIASPKQLLKVTNSIVDKKKYSLNDFFSELENVVGTSLKNEILDKMNKLSIIAFGKEMDLTKSMEDLIREGLVMVIGEIERKKAQI